MEVKDGILFTFNEEDIREGWSVNIFGCISA